MDAIDELLSRGVDTIYPTKEALEAVLRSGKKLRLYQGFDPTGTQLHIGHMAGLRKLRQFQDLGHHVIFLIGDTTGMIGDPSGKSDARKPLTREEVLENAKTYKQQVSKILRFAGENPVEIKYNSEWLLPMKLPDIIRLIGYLSVSQVVKRDMFQKRIAEGKDLFMNEFMYPILQGYDSVAMDVDLEIGGSDQMFNMMTGRDLMRKIKQKEKFVMTTKLLVDKEGKKIGKTEGNVIALTSPPNDLYGMIMNLPDDTIVPAFEYITDVPMEKVNAVKESLDKGNNPMIWKKKLAFTLTRMLNDNEAAKDAEKFFENTFQKRQIAQEAPVYTQVAGQYFSINDFLVGINLIESKSKVRQLLKQGAIEADGQKLGAKDEKILPKDGMILKIGKHQFLKIKVEPKKKKSL